MRGIPRSMAGALGGVGRGGAAPGPQLGARHFVGPTQGPPGVQIPLGSGPYQNNGATQWYASLPMGYPGQTMKLAIDTGSNFIWTTSTLCGQSGCQHYGNSQFDWQASQTFRWLDTTPKQIDYGAWGNMMAERGLDYILMPNGSYVQTPFYLATSYSGSQFQQLDWDGGIGLPSGSDYSDPNIPPMFATMMSAGLINPNMPYMSFVTNQGSGSGLAWLGGYDTSLYDPSSGIFMRWSPYQASVEYIWTTALASMWAGNTMVASNAVFCVDSGSSQFKGDNTIMNTTLSLVSVPNPPDVQLFTGTTMDGGVGNIVIPPSIYNVTIQAGPQAGQTLPQFNGLGYDDLVLVGSVLMDQLYTIYIYDVTQVGNSYHLAPYGMWLFNKIGGPPLIRTQSKTPAALGPRKIRIL